MGVGGCMVQRVDTVDKGVIPVHGGWIEKMQNVHHTIKNSMQFKTYESLISRVFHLYISLLIYLKTFKFKH